MAKNILFLALAILNTDALNFQQQLDDTMSIEWEFSSDTITLRFLVRSNQCKIVLGYCGLGLNRRMIDTDMMIAITTGREVMLEDYYSYFHTTPPSDASLGGTNDLSVLYGGIASNGYINITFERKLRTRDKYDQDILMNQVMPICWAYKESSSGLSQHTRYGNFYKGYADIVFANTSDYLMFRLLGLDATTYTHINLMSICWGVLALIGVIAARYFKWTRWWKYIHVSLFSFVILVTVISSESQYRHDKVSTTAMTNEKLFSSRVGFFILSLLIGQGVFGAFTLYYQQKTCNYKALSFLSRAHKTTGWVLVGFGLYSIYAGSDLLGPEAGVYAFMASLIVFIEIVSKSLVIYNNHSFVTSRLKPMTHEEAFVEIYRGKEYVFVDDLVLDVTNFKKSHPGGQYMIYDTIGEDLGKYMCGCSSYGGNFQPYTHSETAFSLTKYLSIGRIPYPTGYLTSQNDSNQDLMEFQILSQQPLNTNTWLLTLKSDYHYMNDDCDIKWLGKHFKVFKDSGSYKKTRRYYSGLFVNLGIWGRELGIDLPGLNECPGAVKMIYKAYLGGEMTQHFFSLCSGDIIPIQGPLGPGLMLKELKGNYLGFAAGTGLVPFLDLVYLIWLNKSTLKDFSFTLYVQFRDWADGFCLDLLERVQEKILDDVFKLIIVAGVRNTTHSELIESFLADFYDKVWICGPSGFCRNIYKVLIENGVEKKNIVVM